jgi:hypothetical protein
MERNRKCAAEHKRYKAHKLIYGSITHGFGKVYKKHREFPEGRNKR